jgi:acyl-CoA synthetase (AMP-forming)/AMP-acid ligase II
VSHAETIERLVEQIDSYPRQKVACVIGDAEFSYGELVDASRGLAGYLTEIGVRRGERVAIWLPNSFEWVAALLAVGSIGAILVPINTRFQKGEAEYVLRQSESKVLITRTSFAKTEYRDKVARWFPNLEGDGTQEDDEQIASLEQVVWVGGDAPAGAHPWEKVVSWQGEPTATGCQKMDPVLIQYTSGTTSFPKGALLTHYGILHNAYIVAGRMHIGPEDKVFCAGPFFHIGGVTMQVLLSLLFEVPFYTLERFDPATAFEAVARHGCTTYSGIDSLFLMVRNLEHFDKEGFSTVRTGWTAATPEILGLIREELGIEHILNVFGTSETSPNVTITDVDDPPQKRHFSCGRAHPGCEIAIIDPETHEHLPPGERGEIITRGYNVMLGYYGKPDETDAVFLEGGWFRTGDVGSMDADGYLYFHGRYKEIIRVGGENFSPQEVEGILYEHPAVEQVALVGMPDETYGEVPVAVMRTRPGSSLDAEEVREYLAGKVAGFKIPRRVEEVDEFPMTESGKIQKFRVRERLLDREEHR